MDNLLTVLKFSVSGIVVGTAASVLCDQLNAVIQKNIAPVAGTTTAGVLGRTVFDIVVVGGMAAIVIYAGDQAITTFVGMDDPLGRLFYSMIAFNTCGATYQGAKELKSLFVSLMANGGSKSKPPPHKQDSATSPNGGSANSSVVMPMFNSQSIMSNKFACKGSCPNL